MDEGQQVTSHTPQPKAKFTPIGEITQAPEPYVPATDGSAMEVEESTAPQKPLQHEFPAVLATTAPSTQQPADLAVTGSLATAAAILLGDLSRQEAWPSLMIPNGSLQLTISRLIYVF
jgi:hypothetical protein